MLCQYSNLPGKPNEGIHKYRIFGFALVDIIVTIILTIIILLLSKKYIPFNLYNFLVVFMSIFIIGELLHLIFCVNTKFIQDVKKLMK